MTGRSDKTRVVILFGGRSAEHEVSLLSARNVFAAIDREKYQPVLVGIDKQGIWRAENERTLAGAVGDPRALTLSGEGAELVVPVRPDSAAQALTPGIFSPGSGTGDVVVFPVLHGTYGEDGTVQGLLDLAGLPYVGSGTLGSAIGMDKDVSKRLLAQAGIAVVPWKTLRAGACARDARVASAAAVALGYPLFVKPANAGSSVGVSRVKTPADLPAAISEAFRFDEKILLEQAIDAREIECAVLGDQEPAASALAEIVVTHGDGFYSYDAKYVAQDGAHTRIPAELPTPVSEEIRRLAIAAFSTLELSGMARVDFFVDRKSQAVYLNEVNTLPGFTAISMYPKMWEASGVGMTALISQLIELARGRHTRRSALTTSV